MNNQVRKIRSQSPPPTQQQADKLKLAQQAIKKRAKKPDFFTTYRTHIIVSIIIAFLIIVVLSFTKEETDLNVIAIKEIETHNSLDYPFKLGANAFFQNYTIPMAKSLFKNDFTFSYNLTKCKPHDIQLPQKYNFKDAYPECSHSLYNQGNCSSAYIIATVSSFSDRYCKIHKTPQLAAQNLLSCDNKLNIGCKGGQLTRSADYLINHGITNSTCHPFKGIEGYENCNKMHEEYKKYHANNYCKLISKDEIKKDIYMNGPIVVLMPIFKDFLIYKEGIYQVMEGTPKYPGFHAVKVIGWDEEKGYQHWIIENSWGESWGVNGIGKVAMDGFLDFSEYALSVRLE